MNCPYCGAPMEEGVLDSRAPIHWSEGATGMPFFLGKGGVPLGHIAGLLRPKAWICRDCRKVIVNY